MAANSSTIGMPREGNPRIAVIFATMNRRETALRCLSAIAVQSRLPELVIVADNVSSDGTTEALDKTDGLPFRLIVHRLLTNRGNAGGAEEAMDLAFANGVDAVWILDDDSIPRPDALQHLLSRSFRQDLVIHSLQIDPKNHNLTWPMQICPSNGEWRTIREIDELPNESEVETRNNWTGSLVPKKVYEKIGPVMGDLFIRGEDEEYPWRFRKEGFRQAVIPQSILDHPGPPKLAEVGFLGKTIYFEPHLSDWKLYYKIRNMLWLQRRKRGFLQMLAMGMGYAWIVSRIDGINRLPLVLEASLDGILGRLGKWKRHPF